MKTALLIKKYQIIASKLYLYQNTRYKKGSLLLAASTSLIKGGYISGVEIKSTAGYLVSMYDPFSLALGGNDHSK